jgi:hypothetical protein
LLLLSPSCSYLELGERHGHLLADWLAGRAPTAGQERPFFFSQQPNTWLSLWLISSKWPWPDQGARDGSRRAAAGVSRLTCLLRAGSPWYVPVKRNSNRITHPVGGNFCQLVYSVLLWASSSSPRTEYCYTHARLFGPSQGLHMKRKPNCFGIGSAHCQHQGP